MLLGYCGGHESCYYAHAHFINNFTNSGCFSVVSVMLREQTEILIFKCDQLKSDISERSKLFPFRPDAQRAWSGRTTIYGNYWLWWERERSRWSRRAARFLWRWVVRMTAPLLLVKYYRLFIQYWTNMRSEKKCSYFVALKFIQQQQHYQRNNITKIFIHQQTQMWTHH